MSVTEVAAVAAAVAAGVALVVSLVSLVAGTRALTTVRDQVEELRRENRSLADEVRRRPPPPSGWPVAATLVEEDTATPRTAPPRLVSVALSDPVIKAMAVATGTARAVRSFRRTA